MGVIVDRPKEHYNNKQVENPTFFQTGKAHNESSVDMFEIPCKKNVPVPPKYKKNKKHGMDKLYGVIKKIFLMNIKRFTCYC